MVEGVIRYQLFWQKTPLPKAWLSLFPTVNAHRRFAFHLRVIGHDPRRYGGLAYGNLSIRFEKGFIITATQTSDRERLQPEDYCLVEAVDFERFSVTASGFQPPSSEAVTHAAVYRSAPEAQAVLHGHHPLIWRRAIELGFGVVPEEIHYGTPEMAHWIARLVRQNPRQGGLVMREHKDGFLLYAESLDRLSGELKRVLLLLWQFEERRLFEP